jgi:hypothetical protein
MSRQSQTGNTSSDWLMGMVKNHPEGLLLLAAGCALLLRSGGSSRPAQAYPRPADFHGQHSGQASSHSGSGNGESAGDWGVGETVSQAADSARGYASGVAGKVGETASSYASTASSYASSAASYAAEQSGQYARQAQSTLQDTITRVVQDQPLTVALAGLAAGAAIAAMFPATDMEKQTLGPAGQRLTEAAGQLGEQLKEGAAKAGERLMSAAEERGLNADGLKEVAREAAGAFGSSFSGEKEDAHSGSSGGSRNQSETKDKDFGKSSPPLQGGAAWSDKELAKTGGKRDA